MPFPPPEIRTSWRMVRAHTRKQLSYVQAKTNYIWAGKLSGTISQRGAGRHDLASPSLRILTAHRTSHHDKPTQVILVSPTELWIQTGHAHSARV